MRDIKQRAALLEAGIVERKKKVLQTLEPGKNFNIKSSSSSVRYVDYGAPSLFVLT